MDKNLQRIRKWQDKKNALETLPAEYPHSLLKVEQEKKKFNWKSLILSLIP